MLQGLYCRTVEFELEDVDVLRSLYDTVGSSLAQLLLSIDRVARNETQEQVERVVEIQLTVFLVLLGTHGVGRLGQERREETAHQVGVTVTHGADNLLYP